MDSEQQARREGWVPKEEWNGDPDNWVDAETFVERGEKISAILKKKVDSLESRLERAEEANKKFGDYHRKTLDRERQEAQKNIERLEIQLAKAIEEGDGQTFTATNRELEKARSAMPSNEPEAGQLDDAAREWLNNNRWYESDPTLAMFADGAADRIRAQGYTGKAYFDQLTKVVQETFPEKFNNPRRGGSNEVDEGGQIETQDRRPNKTYKSLPADAKKACDMFVAQGIMTREEYVAEYEWDQEEQ